MAANGEYKSHLSSATRVRGALGEAYVHEQMTRGRVNKSHLWSVTRIRGFYPIEQQETIVTINLNNQMLHSAN